jgi:hypothetical protein
MHGCNVWPHEIRGRTLCRRGVQIISDLKSATRLRSRLSSQNWTDRARVCGIPRPSGITVEVRAGLIRGWRPTVQKRLALDLWSVMVERG